MPDSNHIPPEQPAPAEPEADTSSGTKIAFALLVIPFLIFLLVLSCIQYRAAVRRDKRFSGKEEYGRARAYADLCERGAKAKEALPIILKDLSSDDPKLRQKAVRTVGLFGAAAQDAVPMLINELHRDETMMRVYAAEALGLIGPAAAKDGVPALVEALEDKGQNPRVVWAAVIALRSMGPEAKAAIPVLKERQLVPYGSKETMDEIQADLDQLVGFW